MRYLNGRGVTLTHTFIDDETVLTPSPVSVTAYNTAGTSVFTQSGLTPDGDGLYTADAGLLAQGPYRVVWAGANVTDTVYVEVVGAYLFSVIEARAGDPDLADTNSFPTAEIKEKREVVEEEFQKVTGRSFVPRTATVTVECDGSDLAWVGLFDCASLIAISGPTGVLTPSDYALKSNGLLYGLRAFTEGTELTVTVDYGLRSVPSNVRRVGLTYLRYLLAAETSGIPDRATSYVAAEGGTFTLATPGRNGYRTGIPEVDAVLNQYAYRVLFDIWAAG